MQTRSNPAVSIIMPAYNMEKYIGECLDSIFNQTFQNFEIIVVDDCSTDRTVEIVEDYSRRFGKINLIKRHENFGYASTIRNVVVSHARGKYILNMDSDDLLLLDALENFVSVAENFQADMVFTEKYYEWHDDGSQIDPSKFNIYSRGFDVTEPTREPLDISVRIDRFIRAKTLLHFWSKLIRRDFLLKHQIEFDDIPVSCDVVFSFKCHCLANSIRAPFIANIYRIRSNSNSQAGGRSAEHLIRRTFKDTLEGAKAIYQFTQHEDFFRQNPELGYTVVDWFIGRNFLIFHRLIYSEFTAFELESLVREELARDPIGNAPLMVHFFSLANIFFLSEFNLRKENEKLHVDKS